jgi:hypothetical protein
MPPSLDSRERGVFFLVGQQGIEMAFGGLGGPKVFIGQCKWCGVVYWREAVKE